jgi:hypothetical protein
LDVRLRLGHLNVINVNRVVVEGEWLSGPNRGQRAEVRDVRAGQLVTLGENGIRALGSPDHFRAQSGESGAALLALLLPAPRIAALHHGAVRESLAAARAVAIFGQQETRAWDRLDIYVVDNGEGDVGVVQFLPESRCVGGATCHECTRGLDPKNLIATAPGAIRSALGALSTLPLLNSPGKARMTALFWGTQGLIEGPEAWHETYRHGAEVFRRELLADDGWRVDAGEHYEFDGATLDVILRIAARAEVHLPVALTPHEWQALIPVEAEHRVDAADQLLSAGVFHMN